MFCTWTIRPLKLQISCTTSSHFAYHVFSTVENLLKNNCNKNIPITLTVLMRGVEGIHTGWTTKIPNCKICETISNIHCVLDSEDPLPMLTTENGFSGSGHVVWSEVQNYVLTAFKRQRLLLNKWTRNLCDIKKNPIHCFKIKILIISKRRKKTSCFRLISS